MEACYITASWGQIDWLRHLLCFLGGGGVATIIAAAVGLVIIPMTLRENAKRQREQFEEQRDIELARQAFDARDHVQTARQWLSSVHQGAEQALDEWAAAERGDTVEPTKIPHDLRYSNELVILLPNIANGPKGEIERLPAELIDGIRKIQRFGRKKMHADPSLVGRDRESVVAYIRNKKIDESELSKELEVLVKAARMVLHELETFDGRLHRGTSLIARLDRLLGGQ